MKNNLTSSLKSKIIIQKQELVYDESGGFTENWTTLKEVFASVEYQNFSEFVILGKKTLEKNYKITIRYDENISILNRILFQNDTMTIKSINSESNKYTEIFCSVIL
ncbi:phage head closure protein [Candidatus Deianiraea vastatrix]|uniref:Phage head-tail joining protein n=1 Tax=Candidatus Deianiraea vastatrix TaxID=2163644 RepID=A0A5B8XHA4_9RICK|nr:phage head closure protein [Candidatus Deianiraea vastatrix]QED23491.1 Phage head-tail joining protein [Candidatus Deianiraea vastatrix]